MTNQEAFNIMVKGLRKQGEKCESKTRGNRFRLDNKKCAIGFLIKDENYYPAIEGMQIAELMNRGILFSGLNLVFLQEMMYCHDTMSISSWESEFKKIAKKYGLTVPPLNEVTVEHKQEIVDKKPLVLAQ